ncbi:MAG: clostripain-related cysteine peptidase, partial [Planctomycetaceae bacterium]
MSAVHRSSPVDPRHRHRPLTAGERLEGRQLLAAADLLPTLAGLRADISQVVEAQLIPFDGRQIAHRLDSNVGGEVTIYPFVPRWDFSYELSVSPRGRSLMDPVIALYDVLSGDRIAINDDESVSSAASLLVLPLVADKRYVLAVTSYDRATVGAYEVLIEAAMVDDARENDDSFAQATRITNPYTASFDGVLADEGDWFRLDLTGPATAGSNVSLDFDSSLGDLDLLLVDRSGRVLARSNGMTDRETLLLAGLGKGTYFVGAYGYGGAYNPAYTLTSSVRVGDTKAAIPVDRFETNNIRTRATDLGQIVATSEVGGLTLHRKDVDFFKFTLPTAGTATSDGVVSFDAALGDVDVELLDSAGRRIGSSFGTGSSERISLEGLPAGSYFLRVFGYRGVSNPAYSIRFNHGAVLATPITLPYNGDPVNPPPPPPPVNPTNAWTIAVYMTSTDLASFAFDDINEMEEAVSRFAPGASITVFWDQWQGRSFATGGGSQAAWQTAGRAVIAADGNASTIATTFEIVGERNTGDPAVLRDFLSWTMQTRPASRYGVVMWDHGGGLSGVNFDDESGYDSITVKELGQAIANSGMGPSVLMYDACLMGNVEQFYELRGTAPIQVASEEVINGPGFDYRTAFSTLNSSPANVSPESLAQGVVTSFTTQYGSDGASTIAAVNSESMEAVATAMKAFADSTVAYTATQLSRLRALAGQVTRFEFPQYVDLGQLMQRVAANTTLPAASRSAATTVASAISAAVFAKMSDERQTSGMSVYFPTATSQEMSEVGLYADWNARVNWSRVVNRVLGRSAEARGGGVGTLWA